MKTVDLPVNQLSEAPWNPNAMSDEMRSHLRTSLSRFGAVQNLVVRSLDDGDYEVLSGNQRLQVLKEMGAQEVPCVVVDLDDARARLLAQALNRVHGDDEIGLKAELVRQVLETLPREEVVSVLPETVQTLDALASLGEGDLAEQLSAWEAARAARLHHFTAQLSPDQIEVVEQAIERVMARVTRNGTNPNRRGNALYQLCSEYLKRSEPS